MKAIIRPASPCASGINESISQEIQTEALAFSGVAAGLVLSLTSDTPTSHKHSSIILDVHRMRKSRLRRSVLNAANLTSHQLNSQGGNRWKVAMLTLTYAEQNQYSKLHITRLLKCIRAYMQRKGYKFHYVWVLENTKKGKPHYHILVWLPKGVTLPKPDKRGWWVHGSTKIEWIRKNGAAYIAKYCAKHDENQGEFPRGARLHGCGGLEGSRRWVRSWWNLPKYVRKVYTEPSLCVVPSKGGGWVSRETGEWLDSPYKLLFSPLRLVEKNKGGTHAHGVGGCLVF